MAFPATADPLDRAWLNVQSVARDLKSYSQGILAQCAAGNVGGDLIVVYHLKLCNAKASFVVAAAIPGLAQYVKDQFANQSLDIIAEFNTMNAQLDATVNWIISNFPNSGGFIQKDTLTTVGVTVRQFTPAQTAGLQTQISSLIATIN